MDRHQYDAFLGVGYSFFAAALCTTIPRLYTRAFVTRQLALDDYLIAVATILGIVSVVYQQLLAQGVRDLFSLIDPFAPLESWNEEEIATASYVLKLNYITAVMYPVEIGCTKLSLLQFYRRFLTRKPYRIAVIVFSVFTILLTIGACLASIFQCTPVTSAWDYTIEDFHCVYLQDIHIGNGSLNLLSDLAILILPMPTVLRLHTSTRKKYGLIILFSIGVVGSVATAVRLGYVIKWGHNELNAYDMYKIHGHIHIWTQVELNLGILCANLPALTALGRAIRTRKRSTGYSDGYRQGGGHHHGYELGAHASGKSNKGPLFAQATAATTGSTERLASKDNHLFRSTAGDVHCEQAPYTNNSDCEAGSGPGEFPVHHTLEKS